MLAGILSFLSGIAKPFFGTINELHTSEEEKLKLKNVLVEMQNVVTLKVLEYETKLMDAQSSIIKAEAQGASWLQRNWRPLTMITFLVLVVLDSFGWLPNPLAKEAWTLLQIGLGGYVIGRSAEGITKNLKRNK